MSLVKQESAKYVVVFNIFEGGIIIFKLIKKERIIDLVIIVINISVILYKELKLDRLLSNTDIIKVFNRDLFILYILLITLLVPILVNFVFAFQKGIYREDYFDVRMIFGMLLSPVFVIIGIVLLRIGINRNNTDTLILSVLILTSSLQFIKNLVKYIINQVRFKIYH